VQSEGGTIIGRLDNHREIGQSSGDCEEYEEGEGWYEREKKGRDRQDVRKKEEEKGGKG
jgi:hypothetical protein